ncbi:MAG: NAD(P)-binding domain-containing protein, partial [Alphaproteobacteria bacterium]
MRLGLIGFGEAGYAIAKSLAGTVEIAAFDIATHDNVRGPLIQGRAAETGVTLVGDIRDLADHADTIFSVCSCAAAEEVAGQIAGVLSQAHTYCELNSAGPSTKQRAAAALAKSGAQFVDVAVMADVPPHGHRVPLLVAGPGAEAFAVTANELGFRVETMEGEIGSASAVKMFRSVLMKGMGSLILECAQAASQFGMTETVFESTSKSMGMDLMKFANHIAPRQIEHAERRW